MLDGVAVFLQKRELRHLEAFCVLGYQTKQRFAEQTIGSETLDIDTIKGGSDPDFAAHLQTYKDFVRFMKYGVIIVAVILIGMKIFLV